MPTRRTHIVRCKQTSDDGTKNDGVYVDVEVLDAVSFRTKRGEEMVINFQNNIASTVIVDDTDANLGQDSGAAATRRAHVTQVQIMNPDSGDGGASDLYVEVLEAASFRGKRGEEWIVLCKPDDTASFNTTDDDTSGNGPTTRRGHSEKIYQDPAGKANGSSDGGKYITVERTDMISFRSIRGHEMILKMPSGDDPDNGDFPRADTVTTPEGYDPTDTSPDAVVPPDNTDQDFYVHLKGSNIWTGDTKIKQGPFWWIRAAKGSELFVLIQSFGGGVLAGSPFTYNWDNIPGLGSSNTINAPGDVSLAIDFLDENGAPLNIDTVNAIDGGNADGQPVPYTTTAKDLTQTLNVGSAGTTKVGDFNFTGPGWTSSATSNLLLIPLSQLPPKFIVQGTYAATNAIIQASLWELVNVSGDPEAPDYQWQKQPDRIIPQPVNLSMSVSLIDAGGNPPYKEGLLFDGGEGSIFPPQLAPATAKSSTQGQPGQPIGGVGLSNNGDPGKGDTVWKVLIDTTKDPITVTDVSS